MSNNQAILNIIQTITTLFQTLPEKKGRISIDEAIAALNSDDFKDSILNILAKQGKEPKDPKGDKATGEHKLKDENAPKRPKSAYMFFAEKKRVEIKEENPDLKMTEVAKLLGERWKEATPESKAKYAKKAEKDKERYNEEMKVYVRPSDEVLTEQKINQKKHRRSSAEKSPSSGEKSKGSPKLPKSAYMFFSAEKRPEVRAKHPEFKITEVTKELERMWKEEFVTDEDREQYNRLALEDKQRYKSELQINVSDKEIKSDKWYIGEIPSKCKYERLVKIMADALIKFRTDHHKGEDVPYEDVIKIMDLWFEHDAYNEDKFNHLVKDERYDEFQDEVLAAIREQEAPRSPDM